jgi:type IV secretion system protein VirB6
MEPTFTFYADWMQYIKDVCNTYVGQNVAGMAQFAKPWVSNLVAVYVVLWGWASFLGAIQDPFNDMIRRVVLVTAVLTLAFNVAIYNALVVDFFVNAPDALAATMAHGPGGECAGNCVLSGLDTVLSQGYTIGNKIWAKAGMLKGDPGAYFLAIIVWVVAGVVTLYGFFLMALAQVSLSVLLPFGSLFILLLLFRPTASLFDRWLQQLMNYFLIPALVVAVNLIVMRLLAKVATATSSLEVVAVDKLIPFLIMGGVCFMALASVLTIAASLSGGMGLSSFGVGQAVSRWLGKNMGKTAMGAGKVAMGVGSAWAKGSEGVYNASGYVARGAWGAYTGWQARRNSNSIFPVK